MTILQIMQKNTMDLSLINLEEISPSEYSKMREFWNFKYLMSGNFLRVKVKDTFTYDNYEGIISDFIKHPYSDKISIMNNGTWIKRYKGKSGLEISDKEVMNFADIARKDKYHKMFFEIYFKENWRKIPRMKVGFAEVGGLIIGYEIYVAPDLLNLFRINLESQRAGERLHKPSGLEASGLWVPENYKKFEFYERFMQAAKSDVPIPK